MLKPTPSTVKFQAGLGDRSEPTHFESLHTGNSETFKVWLAELDTPAKPRSKRGKAKISQVLDNDISLED